MEFISSGTKASVAAIVLLTLLGKLINLNPEKRLDSSEKN